ncbi:phosphoadenosine phosphosulfate reductase family protein [Sulfurovum sp. XTW-4]|uniref:Phosphoadenosine phosphosulfate reductase family protein n=1 Tax=Sulfurovum xiamenensis TaxID=3019066 RepID=A0ABT7QUM5_9BACT|nr:phosphoadenosine phosphosulfate reductase family protein [Sulfurovum xiamenensis]MDM5264773.1 phosphoadenosine phosphosulfate reductase family protein [Sulfurovum xiamenensis]
MSVFIIPKDKVIKRKEGAKYIPTISGGKDSVSQCDLLLKNGFPVDEIIFCDTFQEFPMMYKYIEKIKKYFDDRYGKKITVLKPLTTFEEWCFGVIRDKNADGYGAIRGIPNPADNESQCYHRRETKVKPSDAYLNEKYPDSHIVKYIGYTKGENRSYKDTDRCTHLYPLKHIFKMTEDDCKKYMIDQEMENPLYKFFSRSGCGICPFQSERSMFQLYHNFRDIWDYMKGIEKRLEQYEKMGFRVMNRYWFTGYRTLEQMEHKFNLNKATLFDFSDEPIRDCFCKI